MYKADGIKCTLLRCWSWNEVLQSVLYYVADLCYVVDRGALSDWIGWAKPEEGKYWRKSSGPPEQYLGTVLGHRNLISGWSPVRLYSRIGDPKKPSKFFSRGSSDGSGVLTNIQKHQLQMLRSEDPKEPGWGSDWNWVNLSELEW
jgi:hypothetical protein